jgi:hypothetical protein
MGDFFSTMPSKNFENHIFFVDSTIHTTGNNKTIFNNTHFIHWNVSLIKIHYIGDIHIHSKTITAIEIIRTKKSSQLFRIK